MEDEKNFEAERLEKRRKAVLEGHQTFSSEHNQPTPVVAHDDIIGGYERWWSEEGVHETYADSKKPVYQPNLKLRVVKKDDGTLIIEKPASYSPYDTRSFDQRWTFDQNGRPVEMAFRSERYYNEFDKDGYVVKIGDIHYGGYGSETDITWGKDTNEGRNVVQMSTQYFTGNHGQRGPDDGQPIVSSFE